MIPSSGNRTLSGWVISTVLTTAPRARPRSPACRRAARGSAGGGGGRRASTPRSRPGPPARAVTQRVPGGIGLKGANGDSSCSSSRSRGAELAERLVVEAGADLPGVAERAVLVVADEQGAELGARALRRREAADHELLLGVALQLQPVARAPAGVGAVGALGDHALEALPARLAVELLAVLAVPVRVEADRALEVERAPQARLALAQRERAQVLALVARQVEDVQEHGHALAVTLLEPLEARDSVAKATISPSAMKSRGRLALERLARSRGTGRSSGARCAT